MSLIMERSKHKLRHEKTPQSAANKPNLTKPLRTTSQLHKGNNKDIRIQANTLAANHHQIIHQASAQLGFHFFHSNVACSEPAPPVSPLSESRLSIFGDPGTSTCRSLGSLDSKGMSHSGAPVRPATLLRPVRRSSRLCVFFDFLGKRSEAHETVTLAT